MRCDDHIVLARKITNKLHTLEVRECITIDHELHIKLFLSGSLDHSSLGINMIICKLS